jgi:hypothetical protein
MRLLKPVYLASAAAWLLAAPLVGQARLEYDGLWLGAGAAPGSGKCTLEFRCSRSRSIGVSAWIAAGGTMSETLLIGMEGIGWAHTEPDTARQFGALLITLYFYATPNSPLHVKAGLGASRYAEAAIDEQGVRKVLTANGLTFLFGIGADLLLGGRVAIVPFLQYVYSDRQSAKRDRLPISDPLKYDLLQLGIGVRRY